MPMRRLSSGAPAPPLCAAECCLGTMTWGQQNSEAEAHEQLDYAWDEAGLNFLDTAEIYPVPPKKETQVGPNSIGLRPTQSLCSYHRSATDCNTILSPFSGPDGPLHRVLAPPPPPRRRRPGQQGLRLRAAGLPAGRRRAAARDPGADRGERGRVAGAPRHRPHRPPPGGVEELLHCGTPGSGAAP